MAHTSPTAASATSREGIVRAFSQLVLRRSNEAMVVSPSARATIGDIDALSRAIGDRIMASALEPGTLVGLVAPNGPAFLAGFLGLCRARQTTVLVDGLAPFEDRQRTLEALGATAVLACPNAWPSSANEFHVSRAATAARRDPLPGIAVVKLTSGSTGAPRGVAMREEHLLADESALARTMAFRDDDRILAAVPWSHSYGFTTLALSAIVRGLTLVLPSDQGPFAPLDAARALGATIFPTVPAYVQALLKMSEPPPWPADLRRVIAAGAALPSATAVQFRETYGLPLHVFYGSSECGGICYDREGGAAERGTVGTPVEGVRIALRPLDPGSDADAAEGLVIVRSAGVGDTYMPEPDSRLGGGRFETSDVAVWQGDELALRRRVDLVINLRGRKVDPSEVERVLMALDGVDEAVVISVPAPGTGEATLRAVVACASGLVTYRGIAEWCRHRLADHKVPRSVVIVDAIPRTSRGKIDRAALSQMGALKHSGVGHD